MSRHRVFHGLPARAAAAAGCAWALLATGCLNEQERDTKLPLLTGLQFEGAARENAQVLLFRVDFRDSDGDLSAGTLTPILNGKPAESEPFQLKTIFLDSGVDSGAASGTLFFELEIAISDDNRPAAGATFDVAVQATDGAGHTSNVPTVTLEISY